MDAQGTTWTDDMGRTTTAVIGTDLDNCASILQYVNFCVSYLPRRTSALSLSTISVGLGMRFLFVTPILVLRKVPFFVYVFIFFMFCLFTYLFIFSSTTTVGRSLTSKRSSPVTCRTTKSWPSWSTWVLWSTPSSRSPMIWMLSRSSCILIASRKESIMNWYVPFMHLRRRMPLFALLSYVIILHSNPLLVSPGCFFNFDSKLHGAVTAWYRHVPELVLDQPHPKVLQRRGRG